MRNENEGLHRKEPGKKKSLTMGRMCANRTTKPTPMRDMMGPAGNPLSVQYRQKSSIYTGESLRSQHLLTRVNGGGAGSALSMRCSDDK